jgi:hypothetical protein
MIEIGGHFKAFSFGLRPELAKFILTAVPPSGLLPDNAIRTF